VVKLCRYQILRKKNSSKLLFLPIKYTYVSRCHLITICMMYLVVYLLRLIKIVHDVFHCKTLYDQSSDFVGVSFSFLFV